MKKAVFKNFTTPTGKLQACKVIKKRLQQRVFPLNIAAASDVLKELQYSGDQLLLY